MHEDTHKPKSTFHHCTILHILGKIFCICLKHLSFHHLLIFLTDICFACFFFIFFQSGKIYFLEFEECFLSFILICQFISELWRQSAKISSFFRHSFSLVFIFFISRVNVFIERFSKKKKNLTENLSEKTVDATHGKIELVNILAGYQNGDSYWVYTSKFLSVYSYLRFYIGICWFLFRENCLHQTKTLTLNILSELK